MVTEEIEQDYIASPQNNETKRQRRLFKPLTSLRNSRLARNWRITLLPALLILVVLVVFNWRLRSRLGPEEPFSTFSMPYEQTFDDVQINRWFSSGGKWIAQGGVLLPRDQGSEPAKVFVPKWLPEGESYHLSVDMVLEEGAQAAGINFNAQYPEIHRDHQRISVTRNGDQLELQAGMVNELDGFQADTTMPLASPAETLKLDLLVEKDAYDVLVNGEMLIQQRPLTYQAGLVGLFAIGGPAKFDNLTLNTYDDSFQVEELLIQEEMIGVDEVAVVEGADTDAQETSVVSMVDQESPAKPEPNAEPVIASKVITGSVQVADAPTATTGSVVSYETENVNTDSTQLTAGLEGWVNLSGQWKAEDGTIVQSEKNGFDLAIGYTESSYSAVDFQTTITHLDGIGAGVLFNMPAANSLKGAHMVRFADWADALVWGYFDETGQFKGQGYAKIESPDAAPHTIGVDSGTDTYAVYLDGQQVAAELPLFSRDGYIGLITTRSTAAFGPIQIGADGQAVSVVAGPDQAVVVSEESGDIFGDIETISGDWVREGTRLSQLNPATYDFSISTGVYAGVYTLKTGITLPDDPELLDAGGGILFHMPGRDNRNGAHMVRLAGRDELIWGYYDQNGAFVGQGRAALEPAEQATRALQVVAGEDAYRIKVDGQDIAQDVPLKQQEGWIGLVSYRGPVVFDGISVTFGTAE